jgi:DNA-directed RNA polymerase specialized sigma24 family protein
MSVAGDNPATPPSDPAPLPPPEDHKAWRAITRAAHAIAQQQFPRRDQHLLEDVVQESLLNLQRYHGRPLLVGWMPLLATIILRTGGRRLKVEQARRGILSCDSAAAEGALAAGPSIPEELIAADELNALEQAVAGLKVKFGDDTCAIVKYWSQEMPWEEIAHAIGIPDYKCQYKFKKAMTWLYQRLSLEHAKGGPHE